MMDFHYSITKASDVTAALDGDTERLAVDTLMTEHDLTGNGGEQHMKETTRLLLDAFSFILLMMNQFQYFWIFQTLYDGDIPSECLVVHEERMYHKKYHQTYFRQ